MMKVLVINAGSSSVKYYLYEMAQAKSWPGDPSSELGRRRPTSRMSSAATTYTSGCEHAGRR